MSIQLYVSNSLNNLAKQLSADLQKQSLGVFEQQQIITQTEGMNNWLKIQIAQEMGITANCSFKKPNDVIAQIYYLLGGKNKPIVTVDFIKWNIYHLLSDTAFQQKFKYIAKYYLDSDIKQIALAAKVADLFDQYQIYRPEIVKQWNETSLSSITDNWQQYLWVSINVLVNGAMIDKTGTIQFIISALQEPSKQKYLQSKLPEISFFGIAVITPFYLNLFNELSRHISINFYLLNPAPTSYWLEDKSEKEIARLVQRAKNKPLPSEFSLIGNSLLTSWGNIIKESFSLLFEDETYINNYNDSLVQELNTPNGLLQKIQHDIFHNATIDRNKIEIGDLKDGSLIINSCFTPVREVEVLYNYLVGLVDQPGISFSARDIVVLVSDIDKYAPFIRAVFDNAPYYFPYTIADETIAVGNSMFSAIELILSLESGSFKAEEILDLLESKYIMERFSITETDTIRKTVEAANIRFGLAGHAFNDTNLVSWQYGLKRMIYGICISGEPLVELNGDKLIPLDINEGADAQDLIRFWHFIQVLDYTIQQRTEPRGIAAWGIYLQELVENMVFQSGEKEDPDYHRLVNYLEKLTLIETISSEPISFEVFKHSLLEILNTETKAQSFASAGITFCSLIPMRSIPFKVVAMMGMDFDKFPRKEHKLNFSLLDKEKRKGDRNVKDNDKHLFLETLLSAQQNFYISYIGHNTKDATKIPPSSLVDELIEYIIQGISTSNEIIREDIIITHPLHGFSQKYFNGSGLISYLSDDKYINSVIPSTGTKDPINVDFDEIAVNDLIRFMKDPICWYFNKVLGIYYNKEKILLPDTEKFSIDKLEEWQIKKDIIEQPEIDCEGYYERKNSVGMFPLKNMGYLAYSAIVDETKPKRELFNIVTQGLIETPIEIDVCIDNSIISGKIERVYGNKLVAYTDSKYFNKHIVSAYVSYIIALAQGKKIGFVFLHFENKTQFEIQAGAISQAEAIKQLTDYISYFKTSYLKPFLFYPGFSMSPLKMFKGDAYEFFGYIESMRNNEHDYTFKDDYMLKAYEADFFTVDTFNEIMINTLAIIMPIETQMPGIIK